MEGTGHHFFKSLFPTETYAPWRLRKSETEFLKYGGWWKDVDADAFAEAFTKTLALQASDWAFPFFFIDLLFSNPYGGPDCWMFWNQREICNVSPVALASAAERAGLDFRIIHIQRSLGAAVVATTIHRPWARFPFYPKMVHISNAFLKDQLARIDKAFIKTLGYDELLVDAEESAKILADWIGFDLTSETGKHVLKELEKSHEFGKKRVKMWYDELDRDQLEFTRDVIGADADLGG